MPPESERQRLGSLLGEVAAGVEDLVATGLTTASEGTLDKLDVGFRAASGQRLLRLGSTLRIANEEIRRYLGEDASFSRRRLAFFLNRAWLLCRDMARVLEAGDEDGWRRLLGTPVTRPVPALTVIALGVAKKVVTGVFCAFDFRLRVLDVADAEAGAAENGESEGSQVQAGQALVWSAIFPIKNPAIPAEAYLNLHQPQKFRPGLLLTSAVRVEGAAVSFGQGVPRLLLGRDSKVEEAAGPGQIPRCAFDLAALRERLLAHEPGPLDLDVELQEEVVVRDWRLGEREPRALGERHVHPLESGGLELAAVVTGGVEGETLGAALEDLRRCTEPPPLYGLLHYELCRLVFQPLSRLDGDWPGHLMLSDDKIGTRELLKALDFTG